MKYSLRSLNGDIGEYLVAFRISKLIGWPCRLMAIDLGIDAEVEIVNENGEATGDIIKLQVKSSSDLKSDNKFSIHTTEEHTNYWKRFSAPVIICGVDLKKEKIYWKQITALSDYTTDGDSHRVDFNTETDELKEDSANAWRKLSSSEESHQLQSLMEESYDLVKLTADEPSDIETCNHYNDHFKKWEELRNRISNIISVIPWKVSGVELERFVQLKKHFRRQESLTAKAQSEIMYY
jgi:hypothetical protein